MRGNVVKVAPGVMGKSWLHPHDGKRSLATGDHDITLTTSQMAEVGSLVGARGTVGTDVNAGGN